MFTSAVRAAARPKEHIVMVRTSGIGSGIGLIVVGAILAFAVDVNLPGVNDNVLGYILMAAGVALIFLTFAMVNRATDRHTIVEDRTAFPVDERRRVL
jgi:O-antigen/teichoic acid export membrane protein